MFKMQRNVLVLSLAIVLLFSAVAFAGVAEDPRDKPVAIKMVTPFASGHIIADACDAFKSLVEEESGGRITVQISKGYGSEISTNLECSKGTVDMQWAGGQPIQEFSPKYFFFNGPFVIKDYAHFERVWKSKLGKDCRDEIEKNGNMVSLSTIYRGFRQTTANKSLTTPDDFAGLRLRLPLVPDWVTIWKAVGTTPIQYPLDQLYFSLKSGQAEASEGDLAQIASYKLNEVQSQLIMTNHSVAVGWSTINKTFYSNLSERDRALVNKCMDQAAWWATLKTKMDEGKYLSQLKSAGMTVIEPDSEAIRAKAKPVVEEMFKTQWPVTTWAQVLAI